MKSSLNPSSNQVGTFSSHRNSQTSLTQFAKKSTDNQCKVSIQKAKELKMDAYRDKYSGNQAMINQIINMK